jgi:hypothetical protein
MPRGRRRIDYAPEGRTPGEMINDVRRAFEGLLSEEERKSIDKGEEATKAVAKKVASAVHNIVGGLSRATAHPPSWFRLATRPVTPKRGRPSSHEGEFIAFVCAKYFKRITDRHANVQTDPETKQPYGAFYDLVVGVFAALSIPDGAERAARSVQKNRWKN